MPLCIGLGLDWIGHSTSASKRARPARRYVCPVSIGAQQFELRLHRAEHAVRLLVLGGCGQYPLGVLRRVRDIVDATLKEHFPRLHYFVALRVSVRCCDATAEPATRLVDLEAAIGQVRRREFGSTESARPGRTSQAQACVATSHCTCPLVAAVPWRR